MRAPVLGSVGLATGSVLLALVGAGPVAAAPWDQISASGHLGTAGAGPDGSRQLGRWTVTPSGAGAYHLTWYSPTRIPTTDAPVQVRHAGSLVTGSVDASSRTVSLDVSSATPPDPSGYDVVLGSRVLDRRGPAPGPSASDRTPYRAPATKALGSDPGE